MSYTSGVRWRTILIVGIMLIMISPTMMINDENHSIEPQVSELDEDKIAHQTSHLDEGKGPAPDPNAGACPCPNYSSIVNMTNNNGSVIDELFVVEGTGVVWQGNYSIDNYWVQSGSSPSGAIWEDINNQHQVTEASTQHTGNHLTGLSGADLWTKAREAYDFYISDENGVADQWGQYLTIETYHEANTADTAVGNNIDTAYLLFEDGEKVYATSVVLYELGTYNNNGNQDPMINNGYVQRVLGAQDGDFTYMGNGWSKMVLCFGEYEDGSCQNATDMNYDPLPVDPVKPPVDGIVCPCPAYESIVNITSGINNAPIDRFFAIEGTSGAYTYEASINTGWIGSGFNPIGDLWEDIPNPDQRARSCVQHNGWTEMYSDADLLTQSMEAYDFYISDANGNFDKYGQYITIEVSHCKTTSATAVGGNIDSAWIQLMDGTPIFPSSVVYYETGDNINPVMGVGTSAAPGNGYVYNVLGDPDGSYTYMGNNWSKMVLCFGEYEDGGCANFSEGTHEPDPFLPVACECPMYESLMGMENTNGATVKSIGIREYTASPYTVTYGNPDFHGPAIGHAQNAHSSLSNSNLGTVPTWAPTSNLFINTDDNAQLHATLHNSLTTHDENRYLVVDDNAVWYSDPASHHLTNPPLGNHGASLGGATFIFDLFTHSNEAYDFYVSDELGNLDVNGQYLTIDVYHRGTTYLNSVGGNIDAVWVELNDGTMVYAKSVVLYEPGTYHNGTSATAPITNDGTAILGPPDAVPTFMGNGFSRIVVCFGVNETGDDIPLRNTVANNRTCDDCEEEDLNQGADREENQEEIPEEEREADVDSARSSVLSGEVSSDNMVDIAVGFTLGALGAILLFRRRAA